MPEVTYSDLDEVLKRTSCTNLSPDDLMLKLHDLTDEQLQGYIRVWKDDYLMDQYRRVGGLLPEAIERLVAYHSALAVFSVERQIRAHKKESR